MTPLNLGAGGGSTTWPRGGAGRTTESSVARPGVVRGCLEPDPPLPPPRLPIVFLRPRSCDRVVADDSQVGAAFSAGTSSPAGSGENGEAELPTSPGHDRSPAARDRSPGFPARAAVPPLPSRHVHRPHAGRPRAAAAPARPSRAAHRAAGQPVLPQGRQRQLRQTRADADAGPDQPRRRHPTRLEGALLGREPAAGAAAARSRSRRWWASPST